MAHELLRQLAKEDSTDRQQISNWTDPVQLSHLNARDTTRRRQVQQFLADGQLTEAEDFYHAALIFQHGETVADFQQAHHLAREAMNRGYAAAKWMFAATFDRWQLAAGKPQQYGTQFVWTADGTWQLAEPVDRNFPDAERAKYNVPPLAAAVREFVKRNQK